MVGFELPTENNIVFSSLGLEALWTIWVINNIYAVQEGQEGGVACPELCYGGG